MDKKERVYLILLALVLSATLPGWCIAANQPPQQQQQQNKKIPTTSPATPSPSAIIGSSVVFPVQGNVYPDGFYYVTFNIGQPPKPYYLDVDTGSDITWLQCDAPCISCSKVPHPLYRPSRNSIVLCEEPACVSLTPDIYKCQNPKEQCDYEVLYADYASSRGVLIRDFFLLRFTNGTILRPKLAFGCGYDQQVSAGTHSDTDGILGLGAGKSSITSQLREQGLTRNVIGHCYSGRGGGYLFFGDDLVPSSGVVWTPMSSNPMHKHYSPGAAELIHGGKALLKGLHVVFDSGSSYTYFNHQAYQAFITSVRKDLTGKPLKEAPDDKTLPVCWRSARPIKSISEVTKYFKPFSLRFTIGKKPELDIPPQSYLIISSHGSVCAGILNGTEVGLENINLVGDISLLDKMVIYDNEKQRIGWAPANCNRLPNVDRDDEDFYHPYAASLGILSENPATYICQENQYDGIAQE